MKYFTFLILIREKVFQNIVILDVKKIQLSYNCKRKLLRI